MIKTDKQKSFNSSEKINYEKIGLKCGIEIHQQLNTGKLFCSCKGKLIPKEKLTKKINRKLRFSVSETGDVDKAAIDEFSKNKTNTYLYNDDCACLVDLDEEPPRKPNIDALNTAIKVSQMLNLTFFDKLQFMRKLIIDGSITSGFQRTAMLGFAGTLSTNLGDVKIDGINLEEDASRIIEKGETENIYALDRQGVPLIEITTGTQIRNPQHAYETAKQIGNLLRSFPQTKRGIGTIRQDLNVSIKGGVRVEIKGTQNLKLIPQIIDAEIKRQQIHLDIINELKNRKIDENNFSDYKIYDVTNVFDNTKSDIIKTNLSKKSSKVLCIKLNKMKNILGIEMNSNYRFATEISDRNKKLFPQIKGLFHADELPKYNITQEEVDSIINKLNLRKEDNFIIIASNAIVARNSLKNVLNIISELIKGPSEEVRQVDPKGTVTQFSRKMSGAARMYPETDIPAIELNNTLLEEQKKNIPELYDKKIIRLNQTWNIEEQKIKDILKVFDEKVFDEILNLQKSKDAITKLTSKQIYSYIFDMPKEIKRREHCDLFDIHPDLLKVVFENLFSNRINKDSLYKLYVILYKNRVQNLSDLQNIKEYDSCKNFEQFLKKSNLIVQKIDEKKIETEIQNIIQENENAPFGALMGICMKHFKGRIEGQIISKILKNNL